MNSHDYTQQFKWGSTMTATNNNHDGHNHDDQLGEIYPTMLNELNCTCGDSFSRFHCCGRHGLMVWRCHDIGLFRYPHLVLH